jgi:hypothetical protein
VKGYTLRAVLTVSACFDELEHQGLVERPVVAAARAFVEATRFA